MQQAKVFELQENLSNVKVTGRSFKGIDLKKRVLRNSVFENCDFDDVDMSEADCTGSSFINCTFRNTLMYRTNFKDVGFGSSIFEPKDAYGITITMECKTFQNMQVSHWWFFAFLMFATQMRPVREIGKEDLRNTLISCIGAIRYNKLCALFSRRDI